MIKRILLLVLVSVLLLTLSACGEEKSASYTAQAPIGGNSGNVVNGNAGGEGVNVDHNGEANGQAEQVGIILQKAQAEISKGDYAAAYLLIKDAKGPEVDALRKNFLFVPVNMYEYTNEEDWERFEYTYTAEGYLETYAVTQEGNGFDMNYRYQNNANGDVVVETWYSSTDGDKLGQENFEYDAQRNITKIECPGSSGYIFEYTYDAKGLMLTRTDRYPKNNSWYLYEYTYDSYGNNTSLHYTTSNGKDQLTEYAYTYDSAGRMTSMVRTSPDGYVYQETYQYDEKGHLVEDGCKYDENGYLTEQPNGLGHVSYYEYDDYGNLVNYTNTKGEKKAYTWKLYYYPNGAPQVIRREAEKYQ